MAGLALRRSTISTVRLLRLIGRPQRRRRIPRQRQPDLIRMEYYKALLPFVEILERAMRSAWSEIARTLERERTQSTADRMDESAKDYLRRLVAEAGAKAADMFNPRDAELAALRYAKRTSDFGKEELGRQVSAALGVSLNQIEKPIVEKLGQFAQENVALIKTVHERYFERIERDALRALEEGQTAGELAEQIERDYGASESDALRIARDQVGKLNAELNQERVEALGITEFIWRTVQDNRVRDEHAELEGQRFGYDDAPEGGPGMAIQCRCYAEPAFDQVLTVD